jgi:O-antigen/teichoic acid export membrane protein
MFLLPLRPAFTDAYILHDYQWIKRIISRINKMNVFFWVVILGMFAMSGKIYSLWIGSSIQIPSEVSLLVAIFVAVSVFKETYVSFINSSGRLNLQATYSVVAIVLHIPLAYFLARVCNLGLAGILILNIFWVTLSFFLWRFQYGKIINNFSGKKIWN